MNRRYPLTYIFLPMIYIGVIVLLLVIQFSGNSIFSDTLGPLSLRGVFEFSDNQDNEVISSLTLEMEGLMFPFDASRPLLLSPEQGVYSAFGITGYEKTNSGFLLHFDQGIRLLFQQDFQEGQFSIIPEIPSTLGVYRALVLPFEPVAGSTFTPTANYPGLDILYRGSRFILTLPPRSIVRSEERQLVVSTDTVLQEIRYILRPTNAVGIFDLWFQGLVPDLSVAEYNNEVQRFIDNAYQGWRTGRFDPVERTWTHRNGTTQFSESIMIPLLAEAWRRNDYARIFTDMRLAADTHRNAITYKSAVFLGNLRQMTVGIEQVRRPEITAISNFINQASPQVFTLPQLFLTAANHGTAQLISSLGTIVESVNPLGLSGQQALGALKNFYLYPVPIPSILQRQSSFFPLIEKEILPKIIRLDEGFFFESQTGQINSLLSLQMGLVLIEAGRVEDDSRLVNLGRHLVTSVLSLADNQGFIPERVDHMAGGITAFARHLGPEDVYGYITNNPYFPTEYSLYQHLGPGTFFYTIANLTSVDVQMDRFQFNIDNTPSRTHYIIIRGIPRVDPFSGTELFGIIFRDAPDFEIYSRGRFFNAASQTLMIKYFDVNPQPRILVFR
jgi:hypothetical protein